MKYLCFFILIMALFLIPNSTNASSGSGACSWHGGIKCNTLDLYDGSVVCEDDWRDSSVLWRDTQCSQELLERSKIEDLFIVSNQQEYRNYIDKFDKDLVSQINQAQLMSHTWVKAYQAKAKEDFDNCARINTLEYCKILIKGQLMEWAEILEDYGEIDSLFYTSILFWKYSTCYRPNYVDLICGSSEGGATREDNIKLVINDPVTGVYEQAVLEINKFFEDVDSWSIEKNQLTKNNTTATSFISEKSTSYAGKYITTKFDPNLSNRLMGNILLQVEEHGEAWYLSPKDGQRYYMKDGSVAYEMMRSFGLGITDTDLNKIPLADSTDDIKNASSICASNSLANRMKGKILLQVQQHGEAYYIYPKNCRRIYMKDGNAAYQIMRYLGLGITNGDLEKIPSN